MKLSEAIAVFDKSAERTTPNKQTEAWAVIRAELVALDAAPVGTLRDSIDFDGDTGMDESDARALIGQRVRLVATHSAGGE